MCGLKCISHLRYMFYDYINRVEVIDIYSHAHIFKLRADDKYFYANIHILSCGQITYISLPTYKF